VGAPCVVLKIFEVESELLINTGDDGVKIALLKDGRLDELQKESDDNSFSVGDIYLGKVKRLVSGLNAAFVDVGYEKDAFLHYHDLGPQVKSLVKFMKRSRTGRQSWSLAEFTREKDIDKNGSMDQVLKPGQDILVQIAKEPISTKGPRTSSELSIAGRYLVLIPFSDRISISGKISSREERERLKRLIKSIRPKGFGVIIRTVAQGKKVADLDADLSALANKWKKLHRQMSRKKPPNRVLTEVDRSTAILRDVFNESFTSIVVDDEQMFEEIKNYVKSIYPEKEKIVKLYKSRLPVFEHFGIERQIKSAFGRSVSMPKGAYLIIEHTEALHVIDVNSGNRSVKKDNQEENALEVNLLAAKEIARQLRLRDMGGIIVVDFIDMQNKDNRKKLYDTMRQEMSQDRAKHKVLPPSRFGLVEITRQRVRPEMNIKTRETIPGEGEVDAPILLIQKLESELDHIAQEDTYSGRIDMHVHSFVAAYINQGLLSQRMKWQLKYKRRILVFPRDSFNYLEYHFYNSSGAEIGS
jgi:ribonuclease G